MSSKADTPKIGNIIVYNMLPLLEGPSVPDAWQLCLRYTEETKPTHEILRNVATVADSILNRRTEDECKRDPSAECSPEEFAPASLRTAQAYLFKFDRRSLNRMAIFETLRLPSSFCDALGKGVDRPTFIKAYTKLYEQLGVQFLSNVETAPNGKLRLKKIPAFRSPIKRKRTATSVKSEKGEGASSAKKGRKTKPAPPPSSPAVESSAASASSPHTLPPDPEQMVDSDGEPMIPGEQVEFSDL